jgi:hypothetical protein
MATIGDTLVDIETIQEEVFCTIKKGQSSQFLFDIMSFTTKLWFELAGHACLSSPNTQLAQTELSKKYFALNNRPDVLKEYIRWTNIGGLFVLWNIFERYIRGIQQQLLGSTDLSISDAYPGILKKKEIGGKQHSIMVSELNAIRKTRNALHQNGIYAHTKKKRYSVRGEAYIFEQGKPVKPMRLILVLTVFWDHYKQIERLIY